MILFIKCSSVHSLRYDITRSLSSMVATDAFKMRMITKLEYVSEISIKDFSLPSIVLDFLRKPTVSIVSMKRSSFGYP